MDKITREQLTLLIELQQKETEADKLKAELDRLPLKLEKMTSILREYDQSIALQRSELDALKKKYRSYDAEIQANQERIKKRDAQLSAVKTNKEYQAILKEIEDIRKAISKMEDETIECLDLIEEAEKTLKAKEKEYAIEEENINRDKEVLEKECEEQEKVLQRLISERDKLSGMVEPGLLKEYNLIKKNVGAPSIVEASDSICQGCHMNIPPQMYNELHRGDELRKCPHCHRMLFVL